MPNQYVNKVVRSDGTTLIDISDSTAVAADVAQGKYFYLATGQKVLGTSTGGTPSMTQHTIYLGFSDNTNTTITLYYNESWVGDLIKSTKPTTYGAKEVIIAQLDGVTWYEYTPIPLNTELIDYTAVVANKGIDYNGELFNQEWCYASDYTPVASNMTFSYTAYYWFYIGLYDESYNFIRSIFCMNDATPDPNDGNIGHGTLDSSKMPSNVAYVRLCGEQADSTHLSLVRTA